MMHYESFCFSEMMVSLKNQVNNHAKPMSVFQIRFQNVTYAKLLIPDHLYWQFAFSSLATKSPRFVRCNCFGKG